MFQKTWKKVFEGIRCCWRWGGAGPLQSGLESASLSSVLMDKSDGRWIAGWKRWDQVGGRLAETSLRGGSEDPRAASTLQRWAWEGPVWVWELREEPLAQKGRDAQDWLAVRIFQPHGSIHRRTGGLFHTNWTLFRLELGEKNCVFSLVERHKSVAPGRCVFCFLWSRQRVRMFGTKRKEFERRRGQSFLFSIFSPWF